MKYKKKPVVIEAKVYTGRNYKEIKEFCTRDVFQAVDNMIEIVTLEGNHFAKPGDYIIKGVQGEHYPCKPDIFKETYTTEAGEDIE